MGEDAGMLDRRHFQLLAGKIREGSSAARRWFAESNRTRRAIWVECGLVRDNAHLCQKVSQGYTRSPAFSEPH